MRSAESNWQEYVWSFLEDNLAGKVSEAMAERLNADSKAMWRPAATLIHVAASGAKFMLGSRSFGAYAHMHHQTAWRASATFMGSPGPGSTVRGIGAGGVRRGLSQGWGREPLIMIVTVADPSQAGPRPT